MNKRIGLLSLFGITVLLLAMVGAITALAAPSAANATGSVALNKTYYTVGGTLVAVVTDADMNIVGPDVVSGAVTLTADAVTGGGQTVNLGVPNISGTPVVVALATDLRAAAFLSTKASATISNGPQGKVLLSTDGTAGVAIDAVVYVIYNVGAVNTVDVTITSTTDPLTGITVTARETASANTADPFIDAIDTGVYKVRINLVDTASSSTTKSLRVSNGDTVTVTYSDTKPTTGTTAVKVYGNGTVETQKPTFSSLVPANSVNTQATSITLSGTVTDSGPSGIDISTVKVVLGALKDDKITIDPAKNPDGTAGAPTETLATVVGATGSASVTFTYVKSDFTAGEYGWYVKATDVAGNLGTSDSDSVKADVQGYLLKIDTTAPVLQSAKTGKFWDLSKTVPAEGSKTTGVVVTFGEDMDIASVQPADFTVGGVAPIAADIYPVTDPTTLVVTNRNKVYLTMGTAIVANATPSVAISANGSVANLSGLTLAASTAATVTATDGIAPTFTLTLDKTITKDTLIATVDSNEAVAGTPFVSAYHSTTGTTAVTPATVPATFTTGPALIALTLTSNSSPTSWTYTFTKSGADGKYSVVVNGSDPTGNAGSKGSASTTSLTAVTFTQDSTVPVPTFTASGVAFTTATEIQGTAPLISVNFGEAVTVTRAAFGTGGVVDVLANGTQSTDKITWLYQTTGLTLGKTYTMTVSATDLAGNVAADKSATFNTIAVKLPETPLKPGQNLISFTGNPVNGDINTVFADAAVTAVVTYDAKNPDPTTGSPWLIATRGLDGKLSGSLAKVDGTHAYFVKSSTFGSVKVEIGKLGFDAVPSVIAVAKGWNLLPVMSVTGANPLAAAYSCDTTAAEYAAYLAAVAAVPPTATAGSCVSADGYLGTIKWVTAYNYNPVLNAWTKVQPKTFANLVVGAGYWVYVSEDGVLVP